MVVFTKVIIVKELAETRYGNAVYQKAVRYSSSSTRGLGLRKRGLPSFTKIMVMLFAIFGPARP